MSSIFAHRSYRHLFAGHVIALFGTGLATVALALLAYEVAGTHAGTVLGTALSIKMLCYVFVSQLAGAYADRLPRRAVLVSLDLVRAVVVLALPFVNQVWQVYVLIALLQSASAVFTPTYQALLPDVLRDERDYTRALSAAQVASTMETLLSPVVAAAVLTVVSFPWLFAGTSLGFVASAVLVATTSIPRAARSTRRGVAGRTLAGMRVYLATPRLRGVLGLNLVIASVGAVVMVNTVNFVRDALGRAAADVAVLLAAYGAGTVVVAVALPHALGRYSDRQVMRAGAVVGIAGIGSVVLLSLLSGGWRWAAALAMWAVIGAGTAAMLTPVGRVLRRSAQPGDRAALFAAQFSLSHACWLVTYPIAGWVASAAGFTSAWIVLATLAVAGLVVAHVCWPDPDPEVLTHTHREPVSDSAHLTRAERVGESTWAHAHPFVIDQLHPRWPTPPTRSTH